MDKRPREHLRNGMLHAFITLVGVPEPAPWERPS